MPCSLIFHEAQFSKYGNSDFVIFWNNELKEPGKTSNYLLTCDYQRYQSSVIARFIEIMKMPQAKKEYKLGVQEMLLVEGTLTE